MTQVSQPATGPSPFNHLPEGELIEQIDRLRQEKNAVILAHNYQIPQIQDLACVTGDSLGLSMEASKTDADIILFCGVHFMAESAKILSPQKRVFLPHLGAGCALADAITVESLFEWKERYPEHTVVTYVNSTAEVKAESDICCTSANAVSVVRSLDTDKVLFTPDKNLARWVAEQVPDKEIVAYDGVCPTHDVLRYASVDRTRTEHPDAIIIAHPECREDVIAAADEVCSTTGMLSAVGKYPDAGTFIIATEEAMIHQLKKRYPDKEFVPADGCIGCRLHCPYMKVTGLQDVYFALADERFEIQLDDDVIGRARRALDRMLAVPRDD
ncbi:MAG TPA: quinolinate synthase NadA [Candidatus Latescibacteria bacterium]|jgi:quinolinate synthase|nr:quinolinate synthase [Gemmatimonadaceae bacterium]MDP6015131.1 quinolinate synthase NadA [Candidatus Latescibacterota bacterium]HJP34117.1 quinolinate synthase NadA [Candidatus Latescibacterota bacterium]